jgi:4'-phosphopantetheinyl transferase
MTAAHLWTLPMASLNPSALEALRQVLSDQERNHAQRFHFERDRRAYVAAHGLVRRALSWCWPDVRPPDWRFTATADGRPEVEAPTFDPKPRFNLSHSGELVACIVTAGNDCGIDVESMTRPLDLPALGPQVLAPAERAEMADAAEERRVERFVRLWTLKEAYAKACGLGLAMAFDKLAFTLGDDGILLDGDDSDDEWTFAQWPIAPQHILSVAVRGSAPIESHVFSELS